MAIDWEEKNIPLENVRVQKLLAAGFTRIARRKEPNGKSDYAGWSVCECGTGRWIRASNIDKYKTSLCKSCSSHKNALLLNTPEGKKKRSRGPTHCRYKGFTITEGYRIIYLSVDHPLRGMADKFGRIREHRLVMAEHVGRMLESWEVVHHKNQNKSDNRIENLELLSTSTHLLVTFMERRINLLESENEKLKNACKNYQDQERLLPSFHSRFDQSQMHVCG